MHMHFKLQYFVLERKLTEFSAILKQQKNDTMPRLVFRQKRGLERGQLQTEGNYKVIACCLYGKTRTISCKE